MSWITTMFRSSVGKKPMMAISGFSFCIFLLAHLCGNLTIYGGKEIFNSYAKHLHSLGLLISISEIGLMFFMLLHITTAIILFFENKKARPIQYSIKKSAGGRTIGSGTMPYTGLILIVFILVHLLNFHFVDKTNISIFNIMQNVFSKFGYICFYLLSISAVSIHVSHGFWSAFQTVGINHTKYTKFIKFAGYLFSIAIGIGFGFIPIYMLLMGNTIK